MKTITSRDNPLYKELKLLAGSSQARRKANRTFLDGIHLCETYLDQVGMPVICIVRDSAQGNEEVAGLLQRCESARTQTVLLPDALYNAISPVENGIGLIFLVESPQPQKPSTLSQSAVLLDNVQDPGNLGSILRSAAAAGITQVFCSPGTVFAWSPKVLRAGMGAHFLLTIYENVDLAGLMRDASVPVLATSSHVSQSIYDVDLRQPAAWLFGHEGQGIAPQLLELASKKVTIPHLGRMESLNVAACAAVCLFEQLRQNRGNK